MEQIDIIKLVIAFILGYGLLFLTMWLFRSKTKKDAIIEIPEVKSKRKWFFQRKNKAIVMTQNTEIK